jgi:hypothetical protein
MIDKGVMLPRFFVLLVVSFVAVTAGFFFGGRDRGTGKEQEQRTSRPEPRDISAHACDTEATGQGGRKLASRPPPPELDIEETLLFIRETRLPMVKLPKQTIAGHATDLNRLLEEQGIPASRFRIRMDGRLEKKWEKEGRLAGGPEFNECELEDASIEQVLRYIADSTIICYAIGKGEVIFTTWEYEADFYPDEGSPNEEKVSEPMREGDEEPDPFLKE